jgi:hypothetical protein
VYVLIRSPPLIRSLLTKFVLISDCILARLAQW